MTARAALRRAALAGGVWLASAGASAGQALGGVERNTREGAEHFENGRLEEALRAFSRARDAWPDAPENDLNLAGVHYRMGEAAPPGGAAAPAEGTGASPFAEAARGYLAALEGPAAERLSGPARRDAFFNLGNTLFRSGAFGDAAAAYGEALALDPEDREARQNLERALLRAEEQEQQQEQQSGEDGEPPEEGNEQQRQQQERSSSGSRDEGSGDEGSGDEGSGGEPPPSESDSEPPREEGDDPESGEPEPEPAAPDDSAPEQDPSGADAAEPSAAQVPEITPEQAERILAALAEVERRFQEERLEKRRARALRRGRH